MKRQQIQIDGHFSVHRGPKRIELDLLQDSYKLNLIWQKASDNRVKLQLEEASARNGTVRAGERTAQVCNLSTFHFMAF